MERVRLHINDFQLFVDTIQNITKITGNLKLIITKNGLESSLADDNEVIRLDVKSDSISLPENCSESNIAICTKNLVTISQLLSKIVKAHTQKIKRNTTVDYSDVSIDIDDTTVFIKSSTLKTSVYLDNEQAVHSINPFKRELTTIAEVSANIDDLKDVISSTFIFKQPDKIIIDICHQDDMIKNIAYASMSDPNDPRTNDIVTKFGNITSGDFTRKVFIDIPKMKYLSMFPVESMIIKFNNEPCFCSEFTINSSSDNGYSSSYRIMGKYVVPKKISVI